MYIYTDYVYGLGAMYMYVDCVHRVTGVEGYARLYTTWLRLFRMNRTNNFDQS